MDTAQPTTRFSDLLTTQREHAPVLARTTAKERKEKLGRILTYLNDEGNKQRLLEALRQDLNKPEVESLLSKTGVLYKNVRYVQGHLREWMEPKGCMLILSP